MKEFLNLIKNRTNERDSFPALNDNIIATFDPLCKEQPVTAWLRKVDECSKFISGLTDRLLTTHYINLEVMLGLGTRVYLL